MSISKAEIESLFHEIELKDRTLEHCYQGIDKNIIHNKFASDGDFKSVIIEALSLIASKYNLKTSDQLGSAIVNARCGLTQLLNALENPNYSLNPPLVSWSSVPKGLLDILMLAEHLAINENDYFEIVDTCFSGYNGIRELLKSAYKVISRLVEEKKSTSEI